MSEHRTTVLWSERMHRENKPKEAKDIKILQSYRSQLDFLDCPYTNELDEVSIGEILLVPGHTRMRILQWIFLKFDSSLDDFLNPSLTMDIGMEPFAKNVLFVASSMGLCRPDDIDLIRGVGSHSKQVAFLSQLLDMVCVKERAGDMKAKAMITPGTVSPAMNLDEQFHMDRYFVDILSQIGNIKDFLPTNSDVLPPEIIHQLELSWQEQGYSAKKRPPPPGFQQLIKDAQCISHELEDRTEQLENLSKLHNLPVTSSKLNQQIAKRLKVMLSELEQMTSSFSYVFETDMRPWCNHSVPQLTELGPAIKRLHTKLNNFQTALGSLSNFRTSYNRVCQDTKESVKAAIEQEETDKDAPPDLDQTIEDFTQVVSVLEESIIRQRERKDI